MTVKPGPGQEGESADFAGGLTEQEARARLKSEGFNELPRQGQRTLLHILLDVLREPMLALLLAGGLIYLALGDLQEALILVAFATLSVLITVVQETRTERALEALRDLTSPRALVIRDGQRKRIAGREVVRGDIMAISEGDRVAADGWLIENDGLQTDESLLTGESVPVRKAAADPATCGDMPRPGGNDLPAVYAGTLVVRGAGLCRVAATGALSEIGRIGQVLSTLEGESPRLQLQTRRLVLWFALFGGAVSLLSVVLYGLTRGDWLEAALAGIVIGMSMLPEEFPVVLTVFMAMGAMRMSRARVLTRRAAAIETLGSATTLCTDKTGTLTENRMTIAELRLPDGRVFAHDGQAGLLLEDEFHLLAEYGILASATEPVDPMEIAFHELGHELGHQQKTGDLQARQDAGWTLRRHYALDPALLAMTHVWGSTRDQGEDYVVATKGAPEAIAELCKLDARARDKLRQTVDAMAAEGLRVLGVAEARWSGSAFPDSQRGFSFTLRGLVGLTDPVRATVPEAVRQCRAAGVRVIMITGDYPQTARAIAQKAGIEGGDVITGDMLAQMDDAALAEHLQKVTIFARIMPEQKLRIVGALKAAGEIVAMTGDGVNDAPSLKAAHIGIAMGGRGTDVAREASAMVLLDDDFGSIVKAVRLGRRIYDNLRKAMGFIIAVHIPIAGLALLPLLFGLPLMFSPIHIAFLEMIIDPVCSLAFEAEREERDVMKRPPRDPDSPLFSRALVGWAVVQGVVALLAVGGLVLYSWSQGLGAESVRAIAFFGLVLTITGLILVNRSFSSSVLAAVRRPNFVLVFVLVAVVVILGLAQFVPAVTSLFKFAPLRWLDLLWIVGAGAAVVAVLEALKAFWRGKLYS